MAPNPNNPAGSDAPPYPSADGIAVEVVKVKVEPTPQEKAQCKAWLDTIARECELHKDLWQNIRKWRAAAAGASEHSVHVNLHQATLETLLPLLYAQDPEVEVKPGESVDDSRYGELRPFCRTLEIVLGRELRDAGLKTHTERVIRSAKVAGFGVVKVIFQCDTEKDPVIVERIADVQDNLKRVAALGEQLADGDEACPEDRDKAMADLQDTMAALQAKVEVLKSIGVVLDFVRADDWMVPYSIGELIDYTHAPWHAQRIWMPKADAVEKFGLSKEEADKLTTYAHRQSVKGEDDREGESEAMPSKGGEGGDLTCCWEVWGKRNQMVYTMLEGLERYAKPPLPPEYTGRRFFPYFTLGFAWVDGRREPLSAVDMADPLVQEYNGIRSGYREHRENCIPAGVFDRSIMDKEDAERLQKRERIEMVGIDANGANVEQAVGMVKYPPVDQALYDTTVIRGELDMIYGVQDAMRGVVMKAKTLGEAEIMQSGLSTRVDGQRGSLEAWLGDISSYSSEVLLLAMPKEQVLRIAGDAAVWPELSRTEIFDLVQVQIRAGTTGKPDKQKDAESWIKLLPQIMPLIQQYVQAIMQNQPGIAEAIKAVVVETLRRFDDRIDADMFIPKVVPPAPVTPGLPGEQGAPVPGAEALPTQMAA